ncbi:putative calcium/potassium channel (CAKC) [Leptomonas pyrrhocoris]|uniref:Putative calcium/potassium channel (CAKC) n=1 Tax=Leptomonas pyrrhocoris TaxID=157538 RepID=A0A0N0DQW8_LEPPY|nr:putative calcium/potassium channel (CAKC) [Leptomonas pyrrhocoris]KPA73788.1 putative calcium/potassium channel (CAKC) [Leptomonas pyrrhocoris]|eukprot:XP_015652227.1 putative calcium/potassium channel (CAKC) [Leptomonas pyrrhocoris]
MLGSIDSQQLQPQQRQTSSQAQPPQQHSLPLAPSSSSLSAIAAAATATATATAVTKDREGRSVFSLGARPVHPTLFDKELGQEGESDEEFDSATAGSPIAAYAVAVPPASRADAQSPVFPSAGPSRDEEADARTVPNVQSLVHVADALDFENHFVIIDLSSAKAKDKSSRYAQEAANTAIAHDVFNVVVPARQAYPMNDVVLLTNDLSFAPYFDYFWSVHKQDTANPVKCITGCGLNTSDLRRCNLEHCAGCCVFYAGDISRYGSTSAMSMLVVLSINEILQGIPTFPVVVELEGLVNLSLFPPHADDPRLRSKAVVDFVYEPNFIIGNAISRLMLFPALQRTYFMEEFIDVMDVLISGHTPDSPALARLPLSLCEVELETYEDVVSYCLKFGFLPIALQRRIVDARNPSINGQRFVLTNPPRALPVNQQTDVLFYITPGS